VTGSDARLAATTSIKVNLERVLLALTHPFKRDQVFVLRFVRGSRDRRIALRKLLYSSELLLGFKQTVDDIRGRIF
jgi:hypothetical protein